MNIGVVIDNELNDDKRVLREIEILTKAGHKVFVLCFGFDNREYKASEGINVSRIAIRRRKKNILFFFLNTIPVYEWLWTKRIKKFITANNIEALHVHDLYMSKAAREGIEKSGKKIPMILDLHENYPYAVTTYNWTRGFFRSMIARPLAWQKKEKEYLGYAYRIIVLSDDFRDELSGRYPELPKGIFTALPNVPDLFQITNKRDVKTELSFNKDRAVILYFGVVAERRGIFDALDVFEQLARENHPSCFLVIGPIDKKDRAMFFTKTGSDLLKERVKYIPWIDLSELPAYLDISDICLAPFHKNPQHESGVANKIFDYMLGKKPLIVSDCKPQAAIAGDFDCGIVYRNNEELIKAIKKLSADPLLRKKMGENGYKAVIHHFNINLIKGALIGLYSDLEASFYTNSTNNQPNG